MILNFLFAISCGGGVALLLLCICSEYLGPSLLYLEILADGMLVG